MVFKASELPVILIITRFLLVEATVKNDFLKEILGAFKERIKTEISSEVIAYVEQEVYKFSSVNCDSLTLLL